jgi:hypothetical protein
MLAWLEAFTITQLVEVPVYFYALHELNFSKLKKVSVAFGASAITHPIVWFIFPVLLPSHPAVTVAGAETFAVAVEAVYLRAFGLRLYFSWSLVANSLSFSVGLLLRRLINFP